jgi:hypothetical protein
MWFNVVDHCGSGASEIEWFTASPIGAAIGSPTRSEGHDSSELVSFVENGKNRTLPFPNLLQQLVFLLYYPWGPL